jgi:hypothetical protein
MEEVPCDKASVDSSKTMTDPAVRMEARVHAMMNKPMKQQMIDVAWNSRDAFMHVPPRLDLRYLESVLCRARGRDDAIVACTATNLCATNRGGVSNSGATVLRLSLYLGGGDCIDLVVKILSPDSVNLFKVDCRFSSRVAEVAWAEWWGKQDVDWVPVIYDTRSDTRSREFWILQEYLPRVGWPGFDPAKPKGTGSFTAQAEQLHAMFRQIAVMHAYSRKRIAELRGLFPPDGPSSGNACPAATLRQWLADAVADPALLSVIGVTEDERRSLVAFGQFLARVPLSVEDWDDVCVTADWGPDNFGIRDPAGAALVTFDWGTTRLAPMEEDIDVVFMRLKGIDATLRSELLAHYLGVYADRTGHPIEADRFLSRLPWARFFVTLRYLLGHLEALRWVPYQTRSRDLVHLFIGLCGRQMTECRTTIWT